MFKRLFARKPPADVIDDATWQAVLGRYPFLDMLGPAEASRLRGMVEAFIRGKHFEGVGGLDITDAMKIEVAAQACLPVLELGLEWYQDWVEIVLYPSQFVPRREVEDEYGIVHVVEEPLAGEAWLGGPVLLSWEDVTAASDVLCFNIVIHEFAHKLDMLNGEANGLPPLHPDMDVRAWQRDLGAAYADFVKRVDASPDPDNDESFIIDPYAAQHPSEFFAVMTEAFFDIPDVLDAEYPAVHAQFKRFYRQDPLARLRAFAASADVSK